MGEFLADFYSSALSERGYSLRIDILIAYDLDQLAVLDQFRQRMGSYAG